MTKKCLLTGKCLNCNGERPDYLSCDIFKQWFKSQQNYSLRSHARAIVEEPDYTRGFSRGGLR